MAQQDHLLSSQAVTTATPYLERDCPCCGANPPPQPEVVTPVDAKTLPYADLVPQWNGFFKEKSIFSYVRCEGCGLLYAPTFFHPEQLARLYAQMPPNMDEVPVTALRATQRGYFEALKRHSPLEGGYVEVGPDVGFFTENCASEGRFSKYWLLEPNIAVEAELAGAVRGHDYEIVTDMLGFSQLPKHSASAAVMVHVLDHLLDPVSTLTQLRQSMTDDGTLLIVTHNEGSLLRKLIGSRWPAFCLQHPQLYEPRSMRRLLAEAGFDVLEITRTVNHFELRFLVKHLLWALGWEVNHVPSFWGWVLGLKLGNMLTIARPRAAAVDN